MNKKIGDPSSKYAYEPHKIDADIQDKQDKYETIEVEVVAYLDILLKMKIKYNDGTIMSNESKIDAIRSAVTKIFIQEGAI